MDMPAFLLSTTRTSEPAPGFPHFLRSSEHIDEVEVELDSDSESDSEQQNFVATRTNCMRTMTFETQIDILKKFHPEFFEGEPLKNGSDWQAEFFLSDSPVFLDSDHESDDERDVPAKRTDAVPQEAFEAAMHKLREKQPELFKSATEAFTGGQEAFKLATVQKHLTFPLRPTKKQNSKAASRAPPPMIAPAKVAREEGRESEGGSTEFVDSSFCDAADEDEIDMDGEALQSLCSKSPMDSVPWAVDD